MAQEKTTPARVRMQVRSAALDIKKRWEAGEIEDLHDAIFEVTDDLFGRLVMMCPISAYEVSHLIETAPACCAIIQVAAEDAWVEDDSGL